MRTHLSSIAGSVVQRCAETVSTTVDKLIADFELSLGPTVENYSRKLVEYCSSKALGKLCCDVGKKIADASFSRFTFDMMLAWEEPGAADEELRHESVSKVKDDRNVLAFKGQQVLQDDVPLFYSDIMPLLVDEERNVGEDAFVWLSTLFPLIADVANARFAFEAFTSATADRLHFPAYDRYLKEIDKCIKCLQTQSVPTGVELAEDEFILHVEGTARTQRVVRHIGSTSWPGRLTLTNRAVYFEASGVISYGNALKIDLADPNIDHQVKSASTGPWGAPLFDKAIVYESSQMPEGVVLEFPEMTSSTRRDHWLALTKEIILLHKFLSKFDIVSPIFEWEMQARTMLGIMRLHASREMLRISPPIPRSFLIFSLFDELPKGDYVLEELYNSLKRTDVSYPCNAAFILKSLNMSNTYFSNVNAKQNYEVPVATSESLESLESTISRVRQGEAEVDLARATVEGLKEEGISDSFFILLELLSPLRNSAMTWIKGVIQWERPLLTLVTLTTALLIIYKEYVGYALASSLLVGVGAMLWARRRRIRDDHVEVVVTFSTSGHTTMESIVTAQCGLRTLHGAIQNANILILKVWSIFVSSGHKQANHVMMVTGAAAFLLLMVPFRFVIMALTVCCFTANLRAWKSAGSGEQGNRRLREWWDSIPVIPVRVSKRAA